MVAGRRAWIEEIVEDDADGRVWLTGVFEATVDPSDGDGLSPELPSWESALAWTRQRADVVYLDLEDGGRYTVHGTDPFDQCQPLAPPAEAALREGRRRPLVDRWLDRGESESPVVWEVSIRLSPDLFTDNCVEVGERLARSIGAALADVGVEDVGWSSDGLVALLAGFPEPEAGDGPVGWTFMGEPDVLLSGRASSPTYRPLADSVATSVRELLNRVNHRTPYEDSERDGVPAWNARVDVHPPGYEAPFGSHYDGVSTVEVAPEWR